MGKFIKTRIINAEKQLFKLKKQQLRLNYNSHERSRPLFLLKLR